MFSILEGRRRVLQGGVLAAAALTSFGGLAVLPRAAGAASTPRLFEGGPTTFSYTPSPQTCTVPADTTQLVVQATGGASGDQVFEYPNGQSSAWSHGGDGAEVQSTLNVTPEEQLTIYVAQQGQQPRFDWPSEQNGGTLALPLWVGQGVGGWGGASGGNGGTAQEAAGGGSGGGGSSEIEGQRHGPGRGGRGRRRRLVEL